MKHFFTCALLLGSIAATMPAMAENKVTAPTGSTPAPASEVPEWLSKLPKFSGYVQTGYLYQNANSTGKDNNLSTFQAKRFRLIMDSKVSEKIDLRAQFELFSSSKDPRGKATFTVMDAFANYHFAPELSIRAGQFYLPVGFENYDISPSTLEAVDFSNLCYRMVCRNQAVAPGYIDYGRDLGLMLYGDALPAQNGGFSYLHYALSLTNGSLPTLTDQNHSKDVAVRLTVRPMKELRIMTSFQHGKYDVKGEQPHHNAGMNRLITGAWYNDPEGLTLRGEYGWLYARDLNIKEQGFYVLAGYHVGKFLPVARYEIYRNKADKLDRINRNSLLLGVAYQPVNRFKLQANYTLSSYTDEIKKSDLKHTGMGHQVQLMCIASF